ncbi:ABC transporter permease [Dactylosporangium sp. CA-233914]|uniref:ABC transporter permease n=1 Tax=Dactylosporangium sp. CA-233914 TaxID=3239934 RepID=UPI003D943945
MLAVLFAVSVLVPGGLTKVSLLSMLPFAAILAIAAAGQTLVVQQRGVDFSVAGVIALSTVIVSKYPGGDGGKAVPAILIALAAGAAAGMLNGFAVTRLHITPLIATLGVNALLLGATRTYSNGSLSKVPSGLNHIFVDDTLKVPNTVWLAVASIAVMALLLKRSTFGRRLEAIGANPRAAAASGLRVDRHVVLVYALGGLCYALAGTVLAAYVETPSLISGDRYLLSTVAAVVIGGTALTGGRASVVASAGAALFLSQLDQFVVALGAPNSVQLLLQSLALALAVGVRQVSGRLPWGGLRRSERAVSG